MLIRPIIENDIPVCAEIVATAPVWQRYGVTVEIAASRLADAMRTDAVILVADDDTGRAMGFVWVLVRGAFDLSSYIRWLAVAPTLRGGGIGQKLLSAAEAQMQSTSRDMFLLCADFNVQAQRFYERYGYQRVGTVEDYVVPGVAEFIYRKRLSAH
jgi:ribosomal protein S18 acetylase RimI-like enzyme